MEPFSTSSQSFCPQMSRQWEFQLGLFQTILCHMVRPVAPRERPSEGMQSVYVSSAPMSQLWAEDFDSSQWIILLFWSALSTSAGDTRTPPGNDGGLQPPLPPPDFPPAVRDPPHPVLIDEPSSDRNSTDDHPMGTPARTASDNCLRTTAR